MDCAALVYIPGRSNSSFGYSRGGWVQVPFLSERHHREHLSGWPHCRVQASSKKHLVLARYLR